MPIKVESFWFIRLTGEYATHPIAQFLNLLTLLLLLIEDGPVTSAPLQGASALACADRFGGAQHAARNPCSTLARRLRNCTLGPVQLRILG